MNCSTCNSVENLRVCSGCYKTLYCSQECQSKHWPMHYCLIKGRKRFGEQLEKGGEKQQRYDPDTLSRILVELVARDNSIMRTFVRGMTMDDVRNWSRVSRTFFKAIYRNNLFWWAFYGEITEQSSKYDQSIDYLDLFTELPALKIRYDWFDFLPSWDNPLGNKLRNHYAEYTWKEIMNANSWLSFYNTIRPSEVVAEDDHNRDVSDSYYSISDIVTQGAYFPIESSHTIGDNVYLTVYRLFPKANINVYLPGNLRTVTIGPVGGIDLDSEQPLYEVGMVVNPLIRVGIDPTNCTIHGYIESEIDDTRHVLPVERLRDFSSEKLRNYIEQIIQSSNAERYKHNFTIDLYAKVAAQ